MIKRGRVWTKQDKSMTERLTRPVLIPQSIGQWNQDYAIYVWNQLTSATGVCINRNVVIDFVYKVLTLNLTSDQLYEKTNPIQCETVDISVWLLFQWWWFQSNKIQCETVNVSVWLLFQWWWFQSNKIQCEFPIGRSNHWEVPMQWTNEYQANGFY